MAIITTDNVHYTNIATKIREKTGYETVYLPSEMVQGIEAVFKAGQTSLLQVSAINTVDELVTAGTHGLIFKWTGATGVYTVNAVTMTLQQDTYYAVSCGCDGDGITLQRVHFSEGMTDLNVYTSRNQLFTALEAMPIDGTLCIVSTLDDSEVEGIFSETFTSADGYDLVCTVYTGENSILISSHEETTDEYGNLTRKYYWNHLMDLPIKVTEKYTIEEVDTLPSENFDVDKVYLYNGNYYMTISDPMAGTYYLKECDILCDAEGNDVYVPRVSLETFTLNGGVSGVYTPSTGYDGIKEIVYTAPAQPTGTIEIYPTKEQQNIDVTTYADATVYGAVNTYDYEDITDLSQVTGENTVYTMPDGSQYMIAIIDVDSDSKTAIPCQLRADIYGGDAPTPVIANIREEWLGGDQEFDVTDCKTFIAHAPGIAYVDITDLSQVTDHSTYYTMPDGNGYMLALDSNGNYRAIRAALETDLNGFDSLVPIIDDYATQEAIDTYVEEEIIGGEW